MKNSVKVFVAILVVVIAGGLAYYLSSSEALQGRLTLKFEDKKVTDHSGSKKNIPWWCEAVEEEPEDEDGPGGHTPPEELDCDGCIKKIVDPKNPPPPEEPPPEEEGPDDGEPDDDEDDTGSGDVDGDDSIDVNAGQGSLNPGKTLPGSAVFQYGEPDYLAGELGIIFDPENQFIFTAPGVEVPKLVPPGEDESEEDEIPGYHGGCGCDVGGEVYIEELDKWFDCPDEYGAYEVFEKNERGEKYNVYVHTEAEIECTDACDCPEGTEFSWNAISTNCNTKKTAYDLICNGEEMGSEFMCEEDVNICEAFFGAWWQNNIDWMQANYDPEVFCVDEDDCEEFLEMISGGMETDDIENFFALRAGCLGSGYVTEEEWKDAWDANAEDDNENEESND